MIVAVVVTAVKTAVVIVLTRQRLLVRANDVRFGDVVRSVGVMSSEYDMRQDGTWLWCVVAMWCVRACAGVSTAVTRV